MMPPSRPGDLERDYWSFVPTDLEGKITSLDELNTRFPASEDYTTIIVLRRERLCTVYGRRDIFEGKPGYRLPLAYHCNHCSTIMMGPPRIEDESSIDSGMVLSGRRGYDVHCTNCSGMIDSHTDELS